MSRLTAKTPKVNRPYFIEIKHEGDRFWSICRDGFLNPIRAERIANGLRAADGRHEYRVSKKVSKKA